MSNYNQTHAQGAYQVPPVSSAPVEGYGQPAGGYMVPPPAGYPMNDSNPANPANTTPVTTQSRGDGFWKGCCAALCCCCVLDACF